MNAGNAGTELRASAGAGDVARVAALLDAGTPVEARDGDGPTPLHAALVARQVGTTRLLLARGAGPETAVYGRTPLSVVAQFLGAERSDPARLAATLELIALLISAGARLDFAPGDERYRPLRIALESAPLPVIDALLAAGAALDPAWARVALEHRRLDVLPRFFERCGAQLDLDGLLLTLAIHAASHRDAPELARELVRRGARVDVADEAGATPLHWAAHWFAPPFLVALLELGAALDRATTRTWTPEDTPKKKGLTPRAQLDAQLECDVEQGFAGEAAAEWQALARACDTTVDAWRARLEQPAEPPTLIGDWEATLARVDADQGPYDLLAASAADGELVRVRLNLRADGSFTLEGCDALLGGAGQWRALEAAVQLDFSADRDGDALELAIAGSSLELYDDSYPDGPPVTWTFDRA